MDFDKIWDYILTEDEDILFKEKESKEEILTESVITNNVFTQKDLGIYINPDSDGITTDMILTLFKEEPDNKEYTIGMRYYQWVYATRNYLDKSLFYLRILNPKVSSELTQYMIGVENELFKRSKVLGITVPDMIAIPKHFELEKLEASGQVGFNTSVKANANLDNDPGASATSGISASAGGRATAAPKKWVAFFARTIMPVKLYSSYSSKIEESYDTAFKIFEGFVKGEKKEIKKDVKKFEQSFSGPFKKTFNYVKGLFNKIKSSFKISPVERITNNPDDKKVSEVFSDVNEKLFRTYSKNAVEKYRTVLYLDDSVLEKNPKQLETFLGVLKKDMWSRITNQKNMFFDIILVSRKNDMVVVCLSIPYDSVSTTVGYLKYNSPMITSFSSAKSLFSTDIDDISDFEKIATYINKHTSPVKSDLLINSISKKF